jgi:hypothetical protein
MHALEQLKNDIRLDTEANYNWEAAMHVNVAIQKVNLTLVGGQHSQTSHRAYGTGAGRA